MRTAAPRHARPFVVLLLATLVACALIPLNAWPFSNWELFSRLRSNDEVAWEAVDVGANGRAHDVWLRSEERCASLLGAGVAAVRLYRVSWLLTARAGHRTAPRHKTLVASCRRKTNH